MRSQDALEHYRDAWKQGHKEARERSAAGLPEYPAVLETILPEGTGENYQDMGVLEIPAHRIIGTRNAGRTTAFTAGFLPLLSEDSEFATKWMTLCDAHLSPEGIREPILCYEYLGDFYVQEGNKRVSVLRYFDAPTVPSLVRRILPPETDEPHIVAYREFLNFYRDAKLYDVQYRTPGCYARLLSHLGKEPGMPWSQREQRTFRAYFQYFKDALEAKKTLTLSPEEALLEWLEVYPFRDLGKLSATQLKKTLDRLWQDLEVLSSHEPVQVETEPVSQEAKSGLLNKLISFVEPEHLHVAFVHQMDPETSTWAKGHDEGRKHLQQVFGDKLTVRSYFHADSPEETEALLKQAVEEGAQLVFTTTPRLSKATRKAALAYPKVRFLNCSVNVPYSSVHSYYCRIFEAKFITGAIAGAMADNDRIGYIASYPIYGVIASINAFALGAQMTNPRAKVDLRWSCLPGDPVKDFINAGYQVISNRDVPTSDQKYLQFGEYGTYFIGKNGDLTPLASPCWLWGSFYERVVRSIFNGTWEQGKDAQKALNYWWGLDSGVIDVELSGHLPDSMQYLAQVLRKGLQLGALDPFHRRIRTQSGKVVNDGNVHFTPEALLHMDWLCENVEGSIPGFEQVLPFAQPMLRELGIYKETIPPEKEENGL